MACAPQAMPSMRARSCSTLRQHGRMHAAPAAHLAGALRQRHSQGQQVNQAAQHHAGVGGGVLPAAGSNAGGGRPASQCTFTASPLNAFLHSVLPPS